MKDNTELKVKSPEELLEVKTVGEIYSEYLNLFQYAKRLECRIAKLEETFIDRGGRR